MPPHTLRAFVALELDPAMRQRLAALIAGLAERLRGVAWTRADSLHLTLRFLGDATVGALEALKPLLLAAARRCPPARPLVSGLGVFPERGPARVLWVGIEVPASLAALQAECEAAARSAGFPPEARAFRPHLTLGRWRSPAPRPALPPVDLGPAELSSLVLYSSELRPGGARHTPLERFALGPSA